MSVAQYDAVDAARKTKPRDAPPLDAGAAAGAAAAVLAAIYPADAEDIDAKLATEFATAGALSDSCQERFRSGVDVGQQIAEAVLERAHNDGSTSVWMGMVPVGRG